MEIPTLLRRAENAALEKMCLDGVIVDIGGDTKSSYRSNICGDHTFVTINLDQRAAPTIVHDLENPLPMENDVYDHALLVNVLEHVYKAEQLLRETVRVVKPAGQVVIVVPFIFPLHPSPKDYWRFTEDALRRLCGDSGISDVKITSLGSGVFAALFVLIDRLMPHSVRFLLQLLQPFVYGFDWVFAHGARWMGKQYRPSDYPLGYVVVGRKST